jgi:hypothetical protein
MNELLREIEEDIRRERMDKLWTRFGRIMVWASLAIIAATAIIVVWQDHTRSVAMSKTNQLMSGIERLGAEDYNGALKIFDTLTQDKNSSYYALAMWHKADAQKQLDHQDDATKIYEELAAQDKNPTGLSDLAKLFSASDKGPLVTVSNDSPFYATVSEWRAWQLLAQDKKSEAADIFMSLRNNIDTPQTMRQRATDTLQHIAPEKLAADRAAMQTLSVKD